MRSVVNTSLTALEGGWQLACGRRDDDLVSALGSFVTLLLLRGGKCAEDSAGRRVRDRHRTAASRELFKAQWGGPGCCQGRPLGPLRPL